MEKIFFHDGSSHSLKIREIFYYGKKEEKGWELDLSLFFGAHHLCYCPVPRHLKTSKGLYRFGDIVSSIIFSFDIMCNVQVNEFVNKI